MANVPLNKTISEVSQNKIVFADGTWVLFKQVSLKTDFYTKMMIGNIRWGCKNKTLRQLLSIPENLERSLMVWDEVEQC